MTPISRRSFVTMTIGALAFGGGSCAAGLRASGDLAALPTAGSGKASMDARECMCLIERLSPDGVWQPSARLLRPSELGSRPNRAEDGRWFLNTGERVSFLRRDVPVRVERKKVTRQATMVIGKREQFRA